MEEEFRDIIGYPGYMIGNCGSVWSNKLKRVLKSPFDKYGYERIGLWNKRVVKKWLVHRLVAIHFIPNPENKYSVNHIDKNIRNNHISNLEWSTRQEQADHKWSIDPPDMKGIHCKPIMLLKDGIRYAFNATSEAQKFLKCSGQSWKRLVSGLKSNIKGYTIE